MQEPIKICVDCGAEYSPMALTCADCGGKLVLEEDYKKRVVPLAEEEEQTLVREGSIEIVRELARHLEEKAIAHRIRLLAEGPEDHPGKSRYGIFVRAEDETEAKEIDRQHWIRGAPEHAASFKYEEDATGKCPACANALPEGAVECPACGLVVGFEEEIAVCPDCDTEVPDDAKKCPKCGAEFE